MIECSCFPPGKPSVIGACACPTHGLKAVTAERDRYREALKNIAELAWADCPHKATCSNPRCVARAVLAQ